MEDYGQVLEVFLNVSDFIAFVWVRAVARTELQHHILTDSRVL
jgi:hypothetical protein